MIENHIGIFLNRNEICQKTIYLISEGSSITWVKFGFESKLTN